MNCSSLPATVAASRNMAHPDCAPAVFAVVPGKTYRFRVASVTSLSALNFEIEVRMQAHPPSPLPPLYILYLSPKIKVKSTHVETKTHATT
jgi:hypothetical protein